MNNASQAQARQPLPRTSRKTKLPGENLSLEETLRVMDVARELRQRRETAEEMFRRDDLRTELREKLLRTARMSGDNVTEAEIETAIALYFENLHTFQEPRPGFKRFMAHCWVWRGRIVAAATALAASAGAWWFLFS